LADCFEQVLNQFVDLFPQLGNGGGLPQAAFEGRADCVKRVRNSSIVADERALGGGVEPEKKRIWTRQTLGKQRRHQGTFKTPAISLRPGAVDDPINQQGGHFPGVTVTVGNFGLTTIFFVLSDSAGMDLNLSAGNLTRNALRDLRSGAVAVDFPLRPHMTQKAASLGLRKRLPDSCCQRSQAVKHTLPLDALLLRLPHLLSYKS
jgi:hypothetical protein